MIYIEKARELVQQGKLLRYTIEVECFVDPKGEATGKPGNRLMHCPAKEPDGTECRRVYDHRLFAEEGAIGCKHHMRKILRGAGRDAIGGLLGQVAAKLDDDGDMKPVSDALISVVLGRIF